MIERRFNQNQASQYLREQGFPVAPLTLQKLRCIGGGPDYEKFGRVPLYTAPALDAYVAARISHPRQSTADQAA